jgi:hypothetical protein
MVQNTHNKTMNLLGCIGQLNMQKHPMPVGFSVNALVNLLQVIRIHCCQMMQDKIWLVCVVVDGGWLWVG